MSALSEEQAKLISKAVHETLFQIGINVDDQNSIEEFRKDLTHLREWRISVNEVKSKGMLFVLATVCSGLAAALWLGLKTFFIVNH